MLTKKQKKKTANLTVSFSIFDVQIHIQFDEMESPSYDAMKTQNKLNLSDENNVSKRDNNTIGADSDITGTGSVSPVQQQQTQQLNEASTVTAATACS